MADEAADRWKNVRRLFDHALELHDGERARFLDAACADDRDLRAEIESLLSSHDRAGSFLEAPIFGAEAGANVLTSGTRLGPYEITELLGVGGMGEVYRARDTRLARDVAVKVLPPGLARNPERLSRFEQEARAASALNHPNIVALHDVGRERGAAYIVTELLEGQTLAERIARGPMPARKAVDCAAQAARGLAAAHERGIVHRDVKPANLFLTVDGQVKILDFGLAKLVDPTRITSSGGASPSTMPGIAMGTVGYMSPEQVRGEAADWRSDQFSLGCVLYELLAGEAPFRRPTGAQTLAAVLEDEPVPIRERNPRVADPVPWILERCLAKDAADRYGATRDLTRDLEHATQRLSQASAGQATVRGARPKPRVIGRVALAAALVLFGAAGAWWLRPPHAVPVVRYLTFSGTDSSPGASPDGRTVAFSCFREGRRGIWIKQLGSGNEVPLTEGEDDNPRFSPDGSRILFSRREGDRVSLYRVPTVAGEVRKLIDDAVYGDFAPDGRICFIRHAVASAETKSIVGIAATDGSAIRELARFPGALVRPRWSPDGRTVAVTETPLQPTERNAAVLIDAASGRSRRIISSTATGVWREGSLAWNGNDGFLYSQAESVVGLKIGSSSRILLQSLRSGKARELLWHPATILTMDVLGPGRLVLEARSLRQNLREFALRPETGSATRGGWLTRGNSTDRQPVYTPDGEWLAFSSNRAGQLDLWALSNRSGAVRRLTDDASEDWDPFFMRDGRMLWSSNRTGHFEIWRSQADGSGALQLSQDGVDAENPMATPDGQWILYSSGNPATRGIMKIRPDGSQRVLLVPGNMLFPELSPDGRHVAFVDERLGNDPPALRVARVADGSLTRFVVRLPAVPGYTIDVGRCRWFPNGRSLAFIGQGPSGTVGVLVQDFLPGRDTAETRRWLIPLDPEYAAESLAISPDGSRVVVSYTDHLFSLMVAENVPGVERPRRKAAE